MLFATVFFVADSNFSSIRYKSVRESPVTAVLIVGLDARSSDDLGLPDSLTLFDIERGSFISIPRSWEISRLGSGEKLVSKYLNVWNCEPFCNIQGIYAYANVDSASGYEKDARLETLRSVVESEYQVKSLAVVAFDLDWAKSFLNNLGSIKVNVEEPIPIGGKPLNGLLVKVESFIPVGMRNLSPKEAFWFARARFGSSNEARMKRQLTLIKSIVNQKSKVDLILAWQGAEGYFRSDLDGLEALRLMLGQELGL